MQMQFRLGPLQIVLQGEDERQLQKLRYLWLRCFAMQPLATPPLDEPRNTLTVEVLENSAQSTLSTSNLFHGATTQSVVETQGHEWHGDTSAPMTEVAQAGHVSLWQQEDAWQIRVGASSFIVWHDKSTARGSLALSFWSYSLLEQRDFWQRIFFLLIRQYNCHLLHANALLPAGQAVDRGLLFVGEGGAGKSTLSLGLIQAGWHYIGDDSILLTQQTDGVVGYGFRRGFGCRLSTVAKWPWLATLYAAGDMLGPEKRLIEPAPRFPGRYEHRCVPRTLCFLQITQATTTTLTPLSATDGLSMLLAAPALGLLLNRNHAQPLFALLHALISQTNVYQLHLGTDLFKTPSRVADLLITLD